MIVKDPVSGVQTVLAAMFAEDDELWHAVRNLDHHSVERFLLSVSRLISDRCDRFFGPRCLEQHGSHQPAAQVHSHRG